MGRELWAARKERVLPHSPRHTRDLILSASDGNLEHVVLDLFSHLTLGNSMWSLSAHE